MASPFLHPSEYMDPSYENKPRNSDCSSIIAAMKQCRQVAIYIDNIEEPKWCSARKYQNAAVLNCLESYKGVSSVTKYYQVPEENGGGIFSIQFSHHQSKTKGAFSSYDIFLIREDGTKSECKIHHGFDSKEIIGEHIDKFEVK